MSGQVHEISLTINGLNGNANVLRSIDVTVGSLFGIVRTNRDSELYVSSSAVNGGLFRVNLATGHCECVLSNGSEDLQCVHGMCDPPRENRDKGDSTLTTRLHSTLSVS